MQRSSNSNDGGVATLTITAVMYNLICKLCTMIVFIKGSAACDTLVSAIIILAILVITTIATTTLVVFSKAILH
ncbi:hypothetical protein Pmar_PMAR009071 [Perkinsus marinus ATCC 50983]|uniref:Transmembrane protein n=1 Tax=Perkinsus marinus (strain ATCC 50983 / TXsc) TaxID=423536 RepID=C5LQ43_PERM5|nr:hypothetical protein Pmar_PMAR009071 [Perkinsus marinus ATCC 50983]EER01151.1 hypothetical protein Pmar_PMAR009071 [Perkinsus marinus ATCC 50983]|eukprot:XP_002768433.1 hypothetical protein Pmar_PMAR009071 [Perkinsus marinus ATCC 50983]